MIDAKSVKAQVSIETILGQWVKLKREGRELVGLCPFHSEKSPSLHITPDRGLWNCFGCAIGGDVFDFVRRIENCDLNAAVEKVAEMAGISAAEVPAKAAPAPIKPKLVATYPYTDENGELLYEVCRYEPGLNGKRKTFKQRRYAADESIIWGITAGNYKLSQRGDWWQCKADESGDLALDDVRFALYRLPEVLAADTVYLVEGEKDADNLRQLGFTATTASGGAGKEWREDYTKALAGKVVYILPDSDPAGLRAAAAKRTALKGVASYVGITQVPDGCKDISDWIATGKTAADIEALTSRAMADEMEREFQVRGLLTPAEVISRVEGGVTTFLDPSTRKRGLMTGYTVFDELTLGLHECELTVLAARPAMGKTALALNIAAHVAEHQNRAVAIFSLEMSSDQLLQRMVCSRARVNMQKFRAGALDKEERARASRAFAELHEMPLYLDDGAGCKLEDIDRKLDLLLKRADPCLVIIDYLQLMSIKGRAENRTQEVSALSRGLKIRAKDTRLPFLVLSQLSRECEKRNDKRPQMSDLRESGSIEQDTDNLAFVYREEVYMPREESLRGRAELILAKQRQGPTGMVRLTYLHQYLKFENSYNGPETL